MYRYAAIKAERVAHITTSTILDANNGFILCGESVSVGDKYSNGIFEKVKVIDVTVTLSDDSCLIGTPIEYLIEFSESVTVPGIVPISITDRNGNHVTNIGCSIKSGKANGSFTMDKAGDFTVTDKAINYHKTAIIADLKLTSQPWLRVYQ